MNWAYLLRCKDGTLYAGWTTDLEKRVETHNSGKGAKYTRGRTPVTVAWAKMYATRKDAMVQEAYLKKLSKIAKEELVNKQPFKKDMKYE